MKAELKSNWISTAASGGGQVVLADDDGNLHVMGNDMQVRASFEGFSCRTAKLVIGKDVPILVGIGTGTEDPTRPCVKIWNIDSSLEYPLIYEPIPLVKNIEAHSLAVTKDISHIAVGLQDGKIILLTGDFMRTGGHTKKILTTEHKLITSLWFSEFQGRLYLFVTSLNATSSFRVTQDNLVDHLILSSTKGSDLSCSAVSDNGELVVGDDKTLISYQPRSKQGGTSLFPVVEATGSAVSMNMAGRTVQKADMGRRLVTWFRRYCVTVDQDKNDIKANSILTIHDPRINIVAYSGSFESITHVLCEWNSLLVITRECTVIILTEIDTKTKMDTLCKKNNYPVALELAISSELERSVISDIHQKYGDHLYGKRDFDGAIAQYIQTIGVLEPSYVIKRFLDAQRTGNLTNYLHKLHEATLANSNHTTLLLNCFTKMSNREELDAFLEKPNLEFDVETAIKVCRQAGYFHEALDLAKRKQRHDWYLKILLEDQGEHTQALQYLLNLPVREAVHNLLQYGKEFVTALPDQTINALISIWDSYRQAIAEEQKQVPSDPYSVAGYIGSRRAPEVQPEDFITAFVEQPQALIQFLAFIVSKGAPSARVCNTLLELYLRNDDDSSASSTSSNPSNKQQQSLSTLSDKKARADAAMALLSNPVAKFDLGHALVLCQVHKFDRGILECYEKLKLYDERLQYFMDTNDHDMVLRSCNRLGKEDTTMWIKALTYFSSRPEASNMLQQVLSTVLTKNKSLPPLQVIRILAQSNSATLDIVRDHIDRSLKDEQRQIDEDAKFIRETREDTQKKKAEIQSLRTEAKIFRQSNCSSCQQRLELPTVHFLCDHAFHLNCLMDENECSICGPEIKNFMGRQAALLGKARQQDEFFKMLDGSADRFGVVAQYFGRSIFNDSYTTANQPGPPSSSSSNQYRQ